MDGDGSIDEREPVLRPPRRGLLLLGAGVFFTLGVAVVLVFALSERTGTGTAAEPGGGEPAPLMGTTWELVELRTGGRSASPGPTLDEVPWLLLAADGRSTWYDGCNWGGNEYVLRSDRLVLGDGGSTTRGCQGVSTAEPFLDVLGGEPVASVAGATLTLSVDGGDALVLQAVADTADAGGTRGSSAPPP